MLWQRGASEIDMVVNVGWVKEGRFDDILDEIDQVKAACQGRLLKVIIETCLLTDQEIISMCQVVSKSKAEYIKTSTGFSKAGATREAVSLMASHVTGGTLVQGGRWYRILGGCSRFYCTGSKQTWYQPAW